MRTLSIQLLPHNLFPKLKIKFNAKNIGLDLVNFCCSKSVVLVALDNISCGDCAVKALLSVLVLTPHTLESRETVMSVTHTVLRKLWALTITTSIKVN